MSSRSAATGSITPAARSGAEVQRALWISQPALRSIVVAWDRLLSHHAKYQRSWTSGQQQYCQSSKQRPHSSPSITNRQLPYERRTFYLEDSRVQRKKKPSSQPKQKLTTCKLWHGLSHLLDAGVARTATLWRLYFANETSKTSTSESARKKKKREKRNASH